SFFWHKVKKAKPNRSAALCAKRVDRFSAGNLYKDAVIRHGFGKQIQVFEMSHIYRAEVRNVLRSHLRIEQAVTACPQTFDQSDEGNLRSGRFAAEHGFTEKRSL